MGPELEADQVKAEIVAAFPEGIGELFYELSNDITHLHLNWQNYRTLYGTSPERIELLNWAAAEFFGLLDRTLLHDVLLRLARLTDPRRSAGHDNASLARLVEDLTPHLNREALIRAQQRLAELDAYCRSIRELRNRILAHDDLATALNFHPEPLPGMSRAYVEGALERVRELINGIQLVFQQSTTYYQQVFSRTNAESLIHVLQSARGRTE